MYSMYEILDSQVTPYAERAGVKIYIDLTLLIK